MRKVRRARIPVQKRGIETRAKLLEAAKVLFVEKGYYNTHGPEIAAQAGLATGTFYSYFNNKKEVLIELMRQFYGRAMDRAISILGEKLLGAGDDRKITRALIKALHTVHAEQQVFHKAIYPLMFMDEDIRNLSLQEDRKVIDLIASYYRAHKDLIHVNNVEAAAELTFRSCDEIVHRLLFWGAQSNGEHLMAELEEMIFKYLFIENQRHE